MELEFEHGGTGTTVEFDKFEELANSRQNRKGGEVLVEKLARFLRFVNRLQPTDGPHHRAGRLNCQAAIAPHLFTKHPPRI